jgi:hypothetical protein
LARVAVPQGIQNQASSISSLIDPAGRRNAVVSEEIRLPLGDAVARAVAAAEELSPRTMPADDPGHAVA